MPEIDQMEFGKIIDALNMDKSNVNRNLKKMMKQKVVSVKHKSYHLNEENFKTMTTCQLL